MNEIEQFQKQNELLQGLLSEMEELGQPRTNYVLKHFVVGSHDLPARQRQQALLELQTMMFSMADTVDEIHLAEIDIAEKQSFLKSNIGDDKFRIHRIEIEIGKLQRKIQTLKMYLSGRLRECETLYSILQKLPEYNREQFEKEEASYWSRRLSRQYMLGQRDVGGNLTAILETFTEPGSEKPQVANQSAAVAAMNLPQDIIEQLSGGDDD